MKCMTVGSLFSGIEGFGLGFEQAGFEVKWQVEKEPFCIAVLKTHFPNVERYYEIKDCGIGRKHKLGAVDIVTAGFPCQDLSVAGKRAGLAGTRSGLFWEAIRIVGELRPTWLVLENVPGLFSSNDGRDFAVVLRELGKLGCFRSIAWTVLDSQYFRVAQRRRRVFIVCGAGVGSAEQVLFEPESGEGDFAESGETWPGIAGSLGGGAYGAGRRTEDDPNLAIGICGDATDKFGDDIQPTLRGRETGGGFQQCVAYTATALSASAGHHGHSSPRGDGSDNLIAHPITASYGKQVDSSDRNGGPPNIITAFALREDPGGIGQGWNTNFIPTVAATLTSRFTPNGHGAAGPRVEDIPNFVIQDVRGHRDKKKNGIGISSGEPCYTLDGTSQHAVAFGFSAGQSAKAGSLGLRAEQSPTLRGASSGTNQVPCAYIEHQERSGQQFDSAAEVDGAVRRDVDECAQANANGVRDFAGLPEGLDSARYRALGNAVTANVARWIATRIKQVAEERKTT